MPNLSDSHLRETFVRKLEYCENHKAGLDDWSRDFLVGIRKRFESREEAEDFGVTPWSPTVKQWNQLGEMALRLGYKAPERVGRYD